MAIFTAIAAAVTAAVTAIGITGFVATAIGYFAAGALALGATRLLAKRMLKGMGSGGSGGGRVQLPPATDNKIPVVYGSAFLSGPIIDAYLTPDQKTMYYVIALAEKTDNGTISFGDIYYDGKLATLVGTQVTTLKTNNANPSSGSVQIDTRVNGKINMWFYNDGSEHPTNSGTYAYNVMPNWNNTFQMTNCAFVIVRVNYNVDAGTTNLGAVMCEVINTESGQATGVYRPGTAIQDYLTNTVYGCAIPVSKVNTASITAINTYSDGNITYTTVGGGSDTQKRYRLNGPLDTSQNCLDNLQLLVDSCDSWLQYNEGTGQWTVVPNAPYTGTIYEINSSNLVGGIQISPIDLNQTYNELEVTYPNANIKDQTDYQIILLQDYQPSVMSPNEATNRLNVSFPLVNNAVQAKYLGIRRLLQSREDLIVSFTLDFSGIQVEAGDVVSITHEAYGWVDKLFRVSQVAEEKTVEGVLLARVEAFEYNETIYEDQVLTDYIPAFNTGLLDPNVFDAPPAPIVYDGNIANSSTTSFNVEGTVPSNGVITYMDFNYGNSSNIEEHLLYRTLQPGTGQSFTSSSNVVINVNDLAAGNLYWSISARNDFAGRQGNASNVYVWPGPAVSDYDPNTGTGGIIGNNIQPNTITANLFITGLSPVETVNSLPTCNATTVGTTVYLTTDGKLYNCNGTSFIPVASNTLITGNIINSQIANIANTKIIGEIVEAQIANAAISQDKIAANAVIAEKIFANAVTAVKIAAGAVEADKILANAVVAGKIDTNAVTAATIAAGAVTTNKMSANSINGDRITAGTIQAAKLSVTQLDAITAAMGTLTSGTITTGNIANGQQRVEISSDGSFPIWYGNGTKDAANAKFYLNTSGNAFFAGQLSGANGTISIDSTAVGNNGIIGILKGAQFVQCRDGDNVVYPVPYPAGTDSRVAVIFIGGGLTYDDTTLTGPQFQQFEAFDITNTGFTASLKLREQFGSANLVTQSDSFSGGITATKSISDVAFDNYYYANNFTANVYCDYFFDFSEFGGGSFYYGYSTVALYANNGTSNVAISTPLDVYASRPAYLGPGYETVSNLSLFGAVSPAPSGTTFTLFVVDQGFGSMTVAGNTLSYTYSSSGGGNTIDATPTGVPPVTALVYLQ